MTTPALWPRPIPGRRCHFCGQPDTDYLYFDDAVNDWVCLYTLNCRARQRAQQEAAP